MLNGGRDELGADVTLVERLLICESINSFGKFVRPQTNQTNQTNQIDQKHQTD